MGNLLPLLWPRLPDTKDVAVTDINNMFLGDTDRVSRNLICISYHLLSVYNIEKIEKLDDTHLLKHMKQNIFLGSLME